MACIINKNYTLQHQNISLKTTYVIIYLGAAWVKDLLAKDLFIKLHG